MINWRGNSGGAVAFMTLFLCVMAEAWILGDDSVDIQTIIEAQKSAIESDRSMVRHLGRDIRAELLRPDGPRDYMIEWDMKFLKESRIRAEKLAQGLAILERSLEPYGECDFCGDHAYLMASGGRGHLCAECDLELISQPEPESVTDADYPAVGVPA